MLRRATALLALLVVPLAVHAQTVVDVTLKEAFAVNADSLQKAASLGASLDRATFQRLTLSPYATSTIRFTAVVLSDPLSSGLASPNNGRPGRMHVFVRDTSAVHDAAGMAGYGAQIVDGDYQTNGWTTLLPGAVVTITGTIAYFSGVPQISPTTVSLVTTDYATLGLPDTIMDPITVSIDDLNGEGVTDATSTNPQSTINLDNYGKYAQEYVRVENAALVSASEGTGSRTGRFNMYFQQGDRTLAFTDISVRYRNDRVGTDYETAGFNVREASNPFTPPAEGSRVNLQGFTVYADFDGENYFNPNMQLAIAPYEDADLEVLPGAPPSVANVSKPTGLVTGTTDVVITADVTASDTRTISTAELVVAVDGGAPVAYTMSNTSGIAYSGTIPASALNDGNFVEYYVRATDNASDVTDSPSTSFRVLTVIDDIADIQTTATGTVGDSPLSGLTVASASGLMNLEVTLQTDPSTSGLYIVQDGTDPWSGIFIAADAALDAFAPGQQLTITGATISEAFGVTQLSNLTFTAGAAGSPIAPVEVTTTALQDAATAEAHEGMMLRFNDVEIASANPDAPSNFGEFSFQTVGTTDALRADDRSNAIASDFNASLAVGTKYAYIQGVMYYSFGNWKLLPETEADLVLATANAPGELPAGFALGQSFPNPASGLTTIQFSLESAGAVTLDVYDTLGRRVARLVDATRPAGAQDVSFDAGTLGAGLYVYRLTAGSQTDTATLVVVR